MFGSWESNGMAPSPLPTMPNHGLHLTLNGNVTSSLKGPRCCWAKRARANRNVRRTRAIVEVRDTDDGEAH